jgi:hypothetical protein
VAFDEGLGERVRAVFGGAPDVTERRMFGGLAFMVAGNMACGVLGDDLMVRVARDDYETTLALPHARQMDLTGRPMRGFVVVDGAGVAEDEDLGAWVERGVGFVRSLPPK